MKDHANHCQAGVAMSLWKPAVLFAALSLAILPAAAKNSKTQKHVTVNLQNGQGKSVGPAVLSKAANGVKIKLNVQSLSPGEHAIHVHQTAKCEAPDFKSAVGPFNPACKHHGLQNPAAPHAYDIPNFAA